MQAPVRAHLLDGSVVVFHDGVTITRDTLFGSGVRYGLDLADAENIEWLELDQLMGMDCVEQEVDGAKGAIVSVLATVAMLVAPGFLFTNP